MGKTRAATLLISALSQRGLKVAPFKPIETGVDHLPLDGLLLRESALAFEQNPRLELTTICPVRFSLPAAPDIARADQPINWDLIDSEFEACKKASDIVIIEGAGGALTPVENNIFNIDLADRYGAKVLLICHDRLGLIHDLLATLESIWQRGFDPIWAINVQGDSFGSISKPWLDKRFGKALSLQHNLDEIIDKVLV